MAAVSWNSAVSADWSVAADWSTGVVPTGTDDVTVGVAGTYTVGIGTAEAAHSITLNNATATISDNASLTLTGALSLTAGTFTLAGSGVVTGGTIVDTAGTLVAAGGTLSGVTYWGTLDLSPQYASITDAGGLVLKGAGGVGNGTVNFTGYDAYLRFTTSTTLNAATIDIGNSGYYDFLNIVAATTTVTLGPALTLQQTGNYVWFQGNSSDDLFVNQGTIAAGFAGGRIIINGGSFTNSGSISDTNTDSIDATGVVFANSGSIGIGGGTLTLANWANTGTISLSSGVLNLGTAGSTAWTTIGTIKATGGTLNLGGAFTAAQLGALSVATTSVGIVGSLDNTGSTLSIGTGSTLGTITLSGTISGGTIADGGSGLIAQNGTLSGVTYRGPLNLATNYEGLHIAGPLVLTGAAGTGAGTIDLVGYAAYLYVDTSTTLNNATFAFGNANTYSYLDVDGAANTLTLGANLSLNQTGTYAYIYGSAGYELLNQGTMTAGATNGRLIVTSGGTFANQGTLTIQNGESVDLTGVTLNNTGSILVSGGTLSLSSFASTGNFTILPGSVLNLGGTLTTAQLNSLSLANVDVGITGTLVNTGSTISLGFGAPIGGIDLTGTIVGGVIVDASGGGLIGQGGTLSGVTYRGTLDLSSSSASLQIAGGITLQGAGGTGPGTILLNGYNDYLYFPTSETLDNATLDWGNATTDYIFLNNNAVTLTLGAHLNIVQTGPNAQLYMPDSGDTVVNQGSIAATYAGGNMSVQYGTFVNQGVISVANGDTFSLNSVTFTNSGTLNVTGATLNISSWTNTGRMNISSTSTLNIGGSFTTAQLQQFSLSGPTVGVGGTLNNAGVTLNFGTGRGVGAIDLTGTISGGALADYGSGLIAAGGTLTGVQYRGTLDLSANSTNLTLAGTETFAGIAGTGAGTIQLDGYNDYLYVSNSMTLNNATINFGDASATDYLYLRNSGVTLTLGSSLTIDHVGANAAFYLPNANDLLVNQGTIVADFAGGRLAVTYGSFTNAGIVSVGNGDIFDLSNTTITNVSGTLLTSGTYSVGAGSTIELANNTTLNTIYLASVTLDGAGSTIQAYNTTNGTQISFDSTLSRIGGAATLALLDGRNFTAVAASGTLTDAGNLVLGDSTVTATKLLLSGGTVGGTGTVSAPIAISGANVFNGGGSLTLNGSLGGTGTVSIAAGTTVALSGTAATGGTGVTVLDSGTLAMSGQTMAVATLTINATGVLSGFGTVSGTVVDNGLIDANGGILYVNLAGITAGVWTGHALESDASSLVRFANNITITSDAGSLTMVGAASYIGSFNTTTSAYVHIDATLSSVTTTGTLALLGGRNFTAVAAGGTFTDAGLLVLGNSTFSATKMVLNAGATINGSGTVTGPIAVNGPASFSGGTLVLNGTVSGAGTLTIAAGELLTLTAAAGPAFTGTVNDLGTLQLAGGTLSTGGVSIAAAGVVTGFGTLTGTVVDAGLVDATGGTLSVAGLANIASGTLTGGQIEADAGSVLQLANNIAIATIAGGVTLSGAGSLIRSLNTTTSAQVSLDSTLATIAATGTLALLNGRSFTAVANGGSFTDAGVLTVSGGTFTATKLTISAGGQLFDAGTIAAPIVNGGTVNIALGTTLTQSAGGALGGTYTGLGTLLLTGATAFTITPTVTTNTGLLQVAGTLSGAGTILAPLEIDGNVRASGGTLTLDGALSGAGTLTATAGATLVFADGGTFFGTVNGAGAIVNSDLINGVAQGVSLAGTGTLSITNTLGGEIYAGAGDAAVLVGGTDIVVNTGAIGGTRNGVTVAGTSGTITNSGLISGDNGAAILGSSGTLKVVNTGLIANYEGVGTAALSLNGTTAATIDNSGTIVGGEYLTNGSAIQFGPGSDRLILRPGSLIVGTVRGGAGANVLELATPGTGTATGTISGLGVQYLQFSSIVEDAAASWLVAGSNTLTTGVASTVSLGAGALLTVDGLLVAPGGETITGAGKLSIDATGTLATGPLGGSTVTVSTATLTDQGLIDVTAGKTLSLAGTALSNLAAGTLTGGAFELDGAATIQLANNGSITTDNASIVLNGTGGSIQWLNTATSTTKTLTSSLGTIGTAGTLSLLNGASFAGPAALTDNGAIVLSNGTVSAATTLTVGATGTLIGSGTVGGSLSVAGLVEASGGSLALSGNVGGAGTIGIDANSVLTASGTIGASGIAFLSDGGQLNLAQPGAVTATIAGFASTDAIDILNTVATSDSFVNNTLTLTGAGGTIGMLHFAGDYSGYHFGLFSDGSGGTNILLT